MQFKILSEITHIETIASGSGVRIRRYLNRTFGRARWRKRKGRALIEYTNGRIVYAEIHWFEAHGIGKVHIKVAREFREK